MSVSVQRDSEVDEFAANVRELLSSRQLLMVPAMPQQDKFSGFVVFLGEEDMSAADFCDVAAAAGAKIMYVQAEAFDAETVLTLSRTADTPRYGAEEDPLLAALRRDASVYNGRIGTVVLGFAVSGVLHCWIVSAPWFERLEDRFEALKPDANRVAVFSPPTEEQRAKIDHLANNLAQMPEFRSAATASQRRRVALTQPEVAAMESDPSAGGRYLAYEVIRKAQETVATEAESRCREMEAMLRELAAEYAATPAFRNAGSSRVRREYARDFLTDKAGGYPPSTRLLELFLDTPPLQKARQTK